MAVLDFLASIVGSLAWPVGTVTIAFVFKKQVVDALGRLTGIKAAGVEMSFDEQLAEVEKSVAKLDLPAETAAIHRA